MDLRTELVRLAHTVPGTRRHIVPVLRRTAASYPEYVERKRKEGEQPLPEEDWRKRVEGADDDPEGAEKAVESPPAKLSLRQRTLNLLKSMKPHPKIVEAIKKAPDQVQRLITDEEHRAKAMSSMAKGLKKSPQAVLSRVLNSAKSEVKELKHAGMALRKGVGCKFKCLDRKDKSAIYSAGVYVAGTVLAMFPPGGPLVAAGALGKSFASHVGLKAINGMIDSGFLHFEALETGHQVLSHILGSAHHIVGKETKRDSDEDLMLAALTGYVIKEIEKGLSDEDIEKILKADPDKEPTF